MGVREGASGRRGGREWAWREGAEGSEWARGTTEINGSGEQQWQHHHT